MKRPSGFDAAPDRRRPSTHVSEPAPTLRSDSLQSEGSVPKSSSGVFRVALRLPKLGRGAAADSEEFPSADTTEDVLETVDLSAAVQPRGEVRTTQREATAVSQSEAHAVSQRRVWRRRSVSSGDAVQRVEEELRAVAKLRKVQEKRERNRFLSRVRARRRRLFVGVGVIVALGVFVAVGVFTPVMSVRSITVEGTNSLDSKEVSAALDGLSGTPLALVNDGDVHHALQGFPQIQSYSFEVLPPDTLLVQIQERVPVLAVKKGKEYHVFDAAGVLLEQTAEEPAGLPVADGKAVRPASAEFRAAAQVLLEIPETLRSQLRTVSASTPQDLSFTLTNGVAVVWGDTTQSQKKAVVLASMMKALSQQSVQMIDVSSSDAPVFK